MNKIVLKIVNDIHQDIQFLRTYENYNKYQCQNCGKITRKFKNHNES